MVDVNSAAFIAVTGNGVTVSEDLARRFLVTVIDAGCEEPEARPFPPGFLEQIKRRRVDLLTAALTIWRWGRQNEATLSRGRPLGSFEDWAAWVRDPLLTLGCCDPVDTYGTGTPGPAWWTIANDRTTPVVPRVFFPKEVFPQCAHALRRSK
jgi:hypothetical protein